MYQKIGLKRDTVDKYYTSNDVVNICISFITENLYINKNDDLCIEPSAGNGSFMTCIKSIFDNYKFYDIEPENDEIIKQDYLTFDYTNILNKYNKIHIIGNPPFGRQSSLAIKFIKKSCEYADSVSFILPKSFKKNSMKKYFPLNYHLIKEHELPTNSFLVDNKTYDVPCVFQIWIKKSINREIEKNLIPNKFKFVKKNENPDISFRRVGVYAGNIDKSIDNKSIQSHYFIKFDNELTDSMLDNLINIKYINKNDTVGPKSISKQELIKEFNNIII